MQKLADKTGLFAKIITTQGSLYAELFYKITPLSVITFAALAQGSLKNWRKTTPFYNNSWFFKAEKNQIMGGDFTGEGFTNAGFLLPDEANRALPFDQAGRIGWVNADRPMSNSSNFFITFETMAHYNAKKTAFAQLIDAESLAIAKKLTNIDKIETIEIVAYGEEARQFAIHQQAFDFAYQRAIDRVYTRVGQVLLSQSGEELFAGKAKALAENLMRIKNESAWYQSAMGLYFTIKRAGNTEKPLLGQTVTVHYAGYFLDADDPFDSSYLREMPYEFPAGTSSVIPCWDEMLLQMQEGEIRQIIAPYQFAYGAAGTPSKIIPEKTAVWFQLELVKIG